MQDEQDKPVLITGASGFVGSHIARLLTRRGRKVHVMLRQTSRQDALKDLPLEIYYGDVGDTKSLVTAMQGCGAVFHCVVDPRFQLTDSSVLYKTNVDGLRNAMESALKCGVDRFIFISTIGTLGVNPGGVVTEEAQFNWGNRASDYILSRVRAEELFFQYCRDRRLPGVALNVAMTYGPEDYQPTPQNRLLRDMGEGRTRFTWNAGSPPVDIRDVAEAAALAEQKGRVGQRYIIANERMSFADLFRIATDYKKLPAPIVVPYWLTYSAAWLGEKVLTLLGKRDFLVRADGVYLSNVFGEMNTRKARSELGWRPRPIRQTVHDTLDWFAQRTEK